MLNEYGLQEGGEAKEKNVENAKNDVLVFDLDERDQFAEKDRAGCLLKISLPKTWQKWNELCLLQQYGPGKVEQIVQDFDAQNDQKLRHVHLDHGPAQWGFFKLLDNLDLFGSIGRLVNYKTLFQRVWLSKNERSIV